MERPQVLVEPPVREDLAQLIAWRRLAQKGGRLPLDIGGEGGVFLDEAEDTDATPSWTILGRT